MNDHDRSQSGERRSAVQANWPVPAEPNTCKLSAALGRAAAPRVLVLSDDARARIQLRVGLAAHGYHVLEA